MRKSCASLMQLCSVSEFVSFLINFPSFSSNELNGGLFNRWIDLFLKTVNSFLFFDEEVQTFYDNATGNNKFEKRDILCWIKRET